MSAELLDIPARETRNDDPQTTVGNVVVFHGVLPSDPTSEQQMRMVEVSGALDFWEKPGENIYSLEDGEPA